MAGNPSIGQPCAGCSDCVPRSKWSSSSLPGPLEQSPEGCVCASGHLPGEKEVFSLSSQTDLCVHTGQGLKCKFMSRKSPGGALPTGPRAALAPGLTARMWSWPDPATSSHTRGLASASWMPQGAGVQGGRARMSQTAGVGGWLSTFRVLFMFESGSERGGSTVETLPRPGGEQGQL